MSLVEGSVSQHKNTDCQNGMMQLSICKMTLKITMMNDSLLNHTYMSKAFCYSVHS